MKNNVKPHPCGYLGDNKKQCKCTPRLVMRYQSKLSGPLMDRIDIHINVPAVDVDKLMPSGKRLKKPEDSENIRNRVLLARKLQQKRFKGTRVYTNSNMKNTHIKKYIILEPEALRLLKQAVNSYGLSARTYFRLIKVSQTIADLEQSLKVRVNHVAEALQYRVRVQE